MNATRSLALLASVAAAGLAAAAPSSRQVVTGPIATYWMSAATTSGMGAMMGGGRPSMSALMGMGHGGGASYNRTLTLQLGSSLRPSSGDPTAEHDPPAGLGVGPVLPLLTPQQVSAPEEEPAPAEPPQFKRPHGRMLIFWGCGEHAPAGQPLVIDFAKMSEGQIPPQYAQLMHGLAVRAMRPPSSSRDASYGEWPNRETRTNVPPQGSLQGDHYIHGDYSPDIRFSLAADQDFLPPFVLTANQKNPSGSATLAWRPVDGSRGYFATMFGAGGGDQMVMWTSSATQTAAFALPDYLSNGEIDRLVGARVLMDRSATSCVIPQEAVAAAGPAGFFQLAAYGGEANIDYPARPPAPQPWRIAWQVKVRYKSTTAGLLGMDLGRMMGSQDGDSSSDQPNDQQQQPQHHSGMFSPFGGLIPH